MATELTLAAALRDRLHDRADVRNVAVRNLAPALLELLGLPGPVWDAGRDEGTPDLAHHDDIEAVVMALHEGVDDPVPQIRGLALVGLGQLGQRQGLEIATGWLDTLQERDDMSVFLRECALISMSLLGAAARQRGTHAAAQGADERSPHAAVAEATRHRAHVRLREALSSPFDDVRFQAGIALAEVGDASVELDIVAALEAEDILEVRENLVRALSTLDPPGDAACDALASLLAESDHGDRGDLGFEAALALTAAHRHEGGERLVEALHTREYRDRALEALALLGEDAPQRAASKIRPLATSWLIPSMTRVRAAYALARVEPAEGMRLLDRLGKSPRPSVRQGVAEARANLELLRARGAGHGDPYRADPKS